MRKLLVAMVLMGILPATHAQSAVFQPLQQVHAAAAEFVMQQAAPGTTVGVAPLDSRLRLPLCGGELAAAATTATATAATVAVRCANPEWTVYVPVRISLRRSVVVLRNSVARGNPLTTADVAVEVREVGNTGYFSEAAQVVGKLLRRPLAPGSVIGPDMLVAPLLVRRGELVTLLGRSGGMEIRTQAKALADGSEGQAVQVQNTASGRVVGGVVRAGGLVEVNL